MLLGAPTPLSAQWSADPNTNNPVCTAAGNQDLPTVVSDGAGGAIITWTDDRSGTSNDIYAQRIGATGAVLWTADGVTISTAAGHQFSPAIASDGAGGAIIAWEDWRSGSSDIYAQRIDASGLVHWTAGGVAISTAAEHQRYPSIVSDASGGAVIAWLDYRNGWPTNSDIYAQRIDSLGAVQWTADGVAISAWGNLYGPTIVSDGAGGAIIAWDGYTGSVAGVFARRINASGAVQWTANGVAICTAAPNPQELAMTTDGVGGAIITWEDYRSSVAGIYAQRIDATGGVQWTPDGVAISTGSDHHYNPAIVSDDSGGAIITWDDQRSDPADIYAQRIDSGGVVQWTPDGVAISTAAISQHNPAIVSDGAGGGIISWWDYRNGYPTNSDIYAQRVNASGEVQWTVDGLAICTAPNRQVYPQIAGDGASGAIITWGDGRNDTGDIYAQYIGIVHTITASAGPNGSITPEGAVSVLDGGNQTFIFTPDAHYQVDSVTVDGSYVGSESSDTVTNVTADHTVHVTFTLNNLDTLSIIVANRWNLVSVPLTVANYAKDTLYPTAISSAYSYQGSYAQETTLVNGAGYWLKFSGGQSIPIAGFLRNLDTIDVLEGWNIVGSISVPVQTTTIESDPSGIVTSQFFGYQGSFVTSDTVRPGKAYWVKVNQIGKLVLSGGAVAGPSARIRIVQTSELPPPPPADMTHRTSLIPNAYVLDQNYPNPFNPYTEIRYGIPLGGDVKLTVYNAVGEVVATPVNGWVEPGFHVAVVDGSALPSGVYFYRLHAGRFTDVRKMSLVR